MGLKSVVKCKTEPENGACKRGKVRGPFSRSLTSGESLRLGGDIVIVFCFMIVVAMFDRSAQAVCTNVAQDDCVR